MSGAAGTESMQLDGLPGGPQLTYCTNIHAGESWDEISASLDEYLPSIKSRVSPQEPFGVGLRLSGMAAAALARPEALARFRDQLARLGAYVFTLNAFPYGPFHGVRVKERVYEPDWRSQERLAFTRQSAHILADLLGEGDYGSISTVPGAFRPVGGEAGAMAAIADHLLEAAAALARIERETGRTIALALEPEPACLLETTEEAVRFFEQHLLGRSALRRFASLADLDPAQAEPTLRAHLGICYDVCHGAVEFEDPIAALRSIKAAGLAVPKIQLSAALRVAGMTQDSLERLSRLRQDTYLHQVVVRNGELERFVDLPDALNAYRAGGARGEWRVHCHVPVFMDDPGGLGSTRDALAATLEALRREALSPHLEVETYTWDVLPQQLRAGSKAQDIARELAFVLARLAGTDGAVEQSREVPR